MVAFFARKDTGTFAGPAVTNITLDYQQSEEDSSRGVDLSFDARESTQLTVAPLISPLSRSLAAILVSQLDTHPLCQRAWFHHDMIKDFTPNKPGILPAIEREKMVAEERSMGDRVRRFRPTVWNKK